MKKTIAIVGSGPSALMLAAHLDPERFQVNIYERNFAPGRKFLVAGDGGFNLTHSEDIPSFISRYTPADFFHNLILDFSNRDLISWLGSIGIPTYTGTSGRIFPEKGIKPIQVLNAILAVLEQRGVKINTQHDWMGWRGERLLMRQEENVTDVGADITVFALGGGSWAKTGSDGRWTSHFAKKGIDILPFQSSNCAMGVKWPEDLLDAAEGQALKNIEASCGNLKKKGEAVITRFGLEGGAVYALSPEIRKQLNETEHATITIDLKPALGLSDMIMRLSDGQKKTSWSKYIGEKLNLGQGPMGLLKHLLTKEEFMDIRILAEKIKALPVTVTSMAPVDEAISTVGGIPLHEIDEGMQLKKLPGNYAIGEMLNWDAPTGGYLLQACFSMGYRLAMHLNKQAAQ